MLGRFAVSAKGQPPVVISFQGAGFVFTFFQGNFIERLIRRFTLGAGFVEKRAGAVHRQRHIFELFKEQGRLFARARRGRVDFARATEAEFSQEMLPAAHKIRSNGTLLQGGREIRGGGKTAEFRRRGQGIHLLPHFRRLIARQRNPQVDEMILHLRGFLLEQALDALLGELRRQNHRDAVVAVKEGQQVGKRGGLRLQGTAFAGEGFKPAGFPRAGRPGTFAEHARAGNTLRAPRWPSAAS